MKNIIPLLSEQVGQRSHEIAREFHISAPFVRPEFLFDFLKHDPCAYRPVEIVTPCVTPVVMIDSDMLEMTLGIDRQFYLIHPDYPGEGRFNPLYWREVRHVSVRSFMLWFPDPAKFDITKTSGLYVPRLDLVTHSSA